jgi:dTDP-4-dehydrorhamnose reductase
VRRQVLVTGAAGQVGHALVATCPAHIDLTAVDRAMLDVTNVDAVRSTVRDLRPDVIINAAAYTAVDQAESDVAAAMAVNADAPRHLAHAAREVDATLLHLSTDYVFDGHRGTPWPPDAASAPRSVYGDSKRRGEEAVRDLLGARAIVVRTSWVYAARGRNFVRSMLSRMCAGDALRVVADQVGAPTSAPSLARALWASLELGRGAGRTLHWTDAGVASWYDLAVAVQEEALVRGMLTAPVPIAPIMTRDYPTAAVRPLYSVLETHSSADAFSVPAEHWRVALRRVMDELRDA